MCIILDNNVWGDFLDAENTDMQPVRKWLKKKNGKLVYSNHPDFKELSKKYRQRLEKYTRSGKADLVSSDRVKKAIKEIEENPDKKPKPRSNDLHILGLAKASKVKVLCTKDKLLHKDFTKIIGGRIYQDKSHEHLLTQNLCLAATKGS